MAIFPYIGAFRYFWMEIWLDRKLNINARVQLYLENTVAPVAEAEFYLYDEGDEGIETIHNKIKELENGVC